MKRLILILLLCTLLTGCCIEHDWQGATCAAPQTCAACGKTEGDSLPHTWQDADCETAKTCTVCGITEGTALGHNWQEASCALPRLCLTCHATEGEALPHTWQESSRNAPKTCSLCGITEGKANNFFAVNGIEVKPLLPVEFVANGILRNPDAAEKQETVPATFHNIQTGVIERRDDGTKVIRLDMDVSLGYKTGGLLGLDQYVMDYNLFDLYTGELIPINLPGMGYPLTVRVDGTAYDIYLEGSMAGSTVGNGAGQVDGTIMAPASMALRFTVTVPEDYDGLVLAIASLKHYNPDDQEWRKLLIEGMFADDFAEYADYYEDVTFFRIPAN